MLQFRRSGTDVDRRPRVSGVCSQAGVQRHVWGPGACDRGVPCGWCCDNPFWWRSLLGQQWGLLTPRHASRADDGLLLFDPSKEDFVNPFKIRSASALNQVLALTYPYIYSLEFDRPRTLMVVDGVANPANLSL